MATNAVWLKIEGPVLIDALREAAGKLEGAVGEAVLDFSSVRRIDANALRVLEKLAGQAEGKGFKLVLRGVNVEVYKVLKLMKLAGRFSFAN